ncbi:hypothetical protein [Pararhizobium antarcticum]|uniref:Uncharacterized protein n=1 Tax=Pararhizobium antarcticum TaxID=1798805 RepID=A0A657LY30_9HYPH|nr:hypothetical protein [Pararhizobium antarcticum]OJF91050.1 hypothetical protein AX761_06205 [Rhizobium sp. 58]OJF99979.1 hypothetical protein AX760_11380 [Pararhizobium antarcticum]
MSSAAQHRAVIELCSTCGKLAFADDLVTVPASEYLALKKAAEASHQRKSLSTYRTISRSKIALEPDLADFIVECAEKMSTDQIRSATVVKFGDRAPSRSGIFRFMQDVRRAGLAR